MTKVNFYILQQQQAKDRDQFACKLVSQLFKQGRKLYLHTADEGCAQAIDELLWAFEPGAFIPHGLLGSGEDDTIAIGWGDDPSHHQDVLINLAYDVPSFIGRFDKVAEIVVQAPEIRDPLRASYKYYKDRGYDIKTNEL